MKEEGNVWVWGAHNRLKLKLPWVTRTEISVDAMGVCGWGG